jgi:hypothetical protein
MASSIGAEYALLRPLYTLLTWKELQRGEYLADAARARATQVCCELGTKDWSRLGNSQRVEVALAATPKRCLWSSLTRFFSTFEPQRQVT